MLQLTLWLLNIYFHYAAFKALGKMILDVGLLLAHHCDQYGKCLMLELLFLSFLFFWGGGRMNSFFFWGWMRLLLNISSSFFLSFIYLKVKIGAVSSRIRTNENDGLEQILHQSRCHKGRLLYYFPAQKR